ncbi:hypothetical protein, partial [Nocardia cyriacigeorgica]|uniref:hypothetical protein n=1 Tax=Nocardia cyriacigeorgica TaxID=135487 RepID=UPI0024551F83
MRPPQRAGGRPPPPPPARGLAAAHVTDRHVGLRTVNPHPAAGQGVLGVLPAGQHRLDLTPVDVA